MKKKILRDNQIYYELLCLGILTANECSIETNKGLTWQVYGLTRTYYPAYKQVRIWCG